MDRRTAEASDESGRGKLQELKHSLAVKKVKLAREAVSAGTDGRAFVGDPGERHSLSLTRGMIVPGTSTPALLAYAVLRVSSVLGPGSRFVRPLLLNNFNPWEGRREASATS
jgi:hypothetical protein